MWQSNYGDLFVALGWLAYNSHNNFPCAFTHLHEKGVESRKEGHIGEQGDGGSRRVQRGTKEDSQGAAATHPCFTCQNVIVKIM